MHSKSAGILSVAAAPPLAIAGTSLGIYEFLWFNEAATRVAWLLFDLGTRSARAFYYGLRAAAEAAGAGDAVAAVVAGSIFVVVSLGIGFVAVWGSRRIRAKRRGTIAAPFGSVAFWLGCAVGAYFIGLVVYGAWWLSDSQGRIAWVFAVPAVLYPLTGCYVRYLTDVPAAPRQSELDGKSSRRSARRCSGEDAA